MIQRALVDVHQVLGLGLVGLVLLILVVAAVGALRGGDRPGLYPILHRVVAALILAQVLFGALLLASGRRPQATLHVVYALVAVLVMPVTHSMVRQQPSRARLYHLGGTILLLGVIFRLATTG